MNSTLNVILWVLQGLMSVVFLSAGGMKIFQPKENLEKKMDWVKNVSAQTVKIIGGLEVLGALGLILPGLTGILPWLTALAAVGLALTMLGAIITHIRLGEMSKNIVPVVFLALLVFMAYARFALAPL